MDTFPFPRPRTGAFGLALCLGSMVACSESERSSPETVSLDVVRKRADASQLEDARSTRLPGAVTGTFDHTWADCSEPLTSSRLVVSADTFEFYYGYALVDSVVSQDEGYGVWATLYELEGVREVVPEAIRYRLLPWGQGDSLLFGAVLEGHSPSLLVRCSES